jgi:hypothetical protein
MESEPLLHVDIKLKASTVDNMRHHLIVLGRRGKEWHIGTLIEELVAAYIPDYSSVAAACPVSNVKSQESNPLIIHES